MVKIYFKDGEEEHIKYLIVELTDEERKEMARQIKEVEGAVQVW
jgi:hypothetical protein